jgi:hypothetical protein
MAKKISDISILLIIDPAMKYMVPKAVFGDVNLEQAVLKAVKANGFRIGENSGYLSFLDLVPKLYPEKEKEGIRKKILGLRNQEDYRLINKAIAYIVSHPEGNSIQRLSDLVGPTQPEDFMRLDCLRRTFAGRFYRFDGFLYIDFYSSEGIEGYLQNPIDPNVTFLHHLHRPKNQQELVRDANVLFEKKEDRLRILRKYGLVT